MSVEAMKQALEELQYVLDSSTNEDLPLHGNSFNTTVSLLKQAIEQAEEQKPVAWGMVKGGEIYDCITPAEHEREQGEYTVPLYAAYGWQSVANPTEYLDDLRGGADE